MNMQKPTFWSEFAAAAREGPKIYFAPVLWLWRLTSKK